MTSLPRGAYDNPIISVWQRSGSQWSKVGEIGQFETLSFAPTFNAIGFWSLTMDYTPQALLLTRDRLVTIDWRGVRSTWQMSTFNPKSDDSTGQPTLSVSGVGAFSRLGWCLAWPDPTVAIGSQPVIGDTDPAPYKAAAETVIKQLVGGNLRDRYGMDIVVPATTGLGSVQSARPVFDKLQDLVVGVANLGGIGVDVGLVDTGGPGSTKAELTLRVWSPADKTKSILLTQDAGTLDGWEQTDNEPTATHALVGGAGTGGADRVFQWPVTSTESAAAATDWGGVREVFVDGPASFDPDELVQAGHDELINDAATRSLALTSSESAGQLAFYDFNVGDKATGQVLTGAAVQDVITSIEVTVDPDQDEVITVRPTFGDPSASDAQLELADEISALKQYIRRLQRK